MRNIYAIRDKVANDLAGQFPLVCMRTDAQAVRYFGDSMQVDRSAISAHPEDYELIIVGGLNEDGSIVPIAPTIVITGQALLAAQEPPKEKLNA